MVAYTYTILYVNDVEKSIAFYERAFGFKRKFVTPEKDYGEIFSGETTISFAQVGLAKSNLPKGFQQAVPQAKPFGIELGFVVEDVQEVVDQVVACGGACYQPTVVKHWGQTVAYVRDINGFLLEICTAIQ